MSNIKKGPILVLIGILVILLAAAACSSKSSTSTNSAPASSSTTAAATFQTMSAAGQSVYSGKCAGCHGANGQGGSGPALWGSAATLGTYNGNTLFAKNAQDMLNFISTKMPLSAPGSLTHEQYLDVLSYILVQGNQVSGSSAFNESQLNSVTLK